MENYVQLFMFIYPNSQWQVCAHLYTSHLLNTVKWIWFYFMSDVKYFWSILKPWWDKLDYGEPYTDCSQHFWRYTLCGTSFKLYSLCLKSIQYFRKLRFCHSQCLFPFLPYLIDSHKGEEMKGPIDSGNETHITCMSRYSRHVMSTTKALFFL